MAEEDTKPRPRSEPPRDRTLGGGDIRRGMDRLVTVTPQADTMTPEQAVDAVQPQTQDTKKE
jgi:hypothetical protein